jgi:hypothetical protein
MALQADNLRRIERIVARVADRNDMGTRANEARRTRLVIVGDVAFFLKGGTVGTSEESSFKIDSSQSPKQIQAPAVVGPDKGTTFLGIYDFGPTGTGFVSPFPASPPDKIRIRARQRRPSAGLVARKAAEIAGAKDEEQVPRVLSLLKSIILE